MSDKNDRDNLGKQDLILSAVKTRGKSDPLEYPHVSYSCKHK